MIFEGSTDASVPREELKGWTKQKEDRNQHHVYEVRDCRGKSHLLYLSINRFQRVMPSGGLTALLSPTPSLALRDTNVKLARNGTLNTIRQDETVPSPAH